MAGGVDWVWPSAGAKLAARAASEKVRARRAPFILDGIMIIAGLNKRCRATMCAGANHRPRFIAKRSSAPCRM